MTKKAFPELKINLFCTSKINYEITNACNQCTILITNSMAILINCLDANGQIAHWGANH